ncbi:MAG: lipopolysaccharide biosynthesis protein [Syntrophobacteraceae bacterium]
MNVGNPAISRLYVPLSLASNFSWTLTGNVVYTGCQWAMLTALAKLGSPGMVGQFVLGLAVTAPVIMFSNLQLRAVQATDATREYRFGDYLGLRLVCTLLAVAAIIAVTFLSGYKGETAAVILAVGAAKTFESISDIYYGLLQQRERMDYIARSMMVKGPLSLIALATGSYVTGHIFWGACAMALVWGAVLVLYDIPVAGIVLSGENERTGEHEGAWSIFAAIKPRWNRSVLGSLAWRSLPLGLVMMLISLNANIPRYFIVHYPGTEQLGIFAAMAYFMLAGNTIVGALGQSAAPKLARHYAEGRIRAFRSLLMKLVGIGVLLGAVGILVATVAGREVLTFLYTPQYAERVDVLVWLMGAAAVSYVASFLGYGMTAARYFRVQTPLMASVSVCSALACLWLIPGSGIFGAARAMVISLLVQLAGSALINMHALHKLGREVTVK